MKNKILIVLTFVLVLFTVISCQKNNSLGTENNPNSNPQQLQILKTDLKLTQEQVLSQIKADHIKENGGYLDSDEIVAIITLPDESLIETYNKENSSLVDTVSSFVLSEMGTKQTQQLMKQQEKLIRELYANQLIDSVEYQ